MFVVVSVIQEKVAQTACLSACKHIAEMLKEILSDVTVRSITMASLQQFNVDLQMCEGQ